MNYHQYRAYDFLICVSLIRGRYLLDGREEKCALNLNLNYLSCNHACVVSSLLISGSFNFVYMFDLMFDLMFDFILFQCFVTNGFNPPSQRPGLNQASTLISQLLFCWNLLGRLSLLIDHFKSYI